MNIRLNTLIDTVEAVIETSAILLGRIEKVESRVEFWVTETAKSRVEIITRIEKLEESLNDWGVEVVRLRRDFEVTPRSLEVELFNTPEK